MSDISPFRSPLVSIAWESEAHFPTAYLIEAPSYLSFAQFTERCLPAVFAHLAGFDSVDWWQTKWRKNGEAWWPNPRLNLRDNGVAHLDSISFQVVSS
jgi:Phenol hydroxylase conserved region